MRILFASSFASLAIARLSVFVDVAIERNYRVLELIMTPVIAVCRYLFERTARHSISLPKLISFRTIRELKPVYRESYWTDGLSLRAPPLRC